MVVAEVLTRERDEGRPLAAGEKGHQLPLAWALWETDRLPVALFKIVDLLDRWICNTLSAWQV